jgi:hypothetical protein
MSEVISSIAYGDADMLESLTDITMNTLSRSGLDERAYTIARISALIALDSPAEAYGIGLSGMDEGLESDDLEGLLIALAPVVGSARIASGAASILDAFYDETDFVVEEIEIVEDADGDIVEIVAIAEGVAVVDAEAVEADEVADGADAEPATLEHAENENVVAL